MCKNLTISGSTPPPPAQLPTVISADFSYESDCAIIESCTKNVVDLGEQYISVLVKVNSYAARTYNCEIRFIADGTSVSLTGTVALLVGNNLSVCLTANELQYKNYSRLTNLEFVFVS